MITFLFIFILIFLTLCSGYFSLSQIALFSLSSSEIKVFKQSGNPRKELVANLLARPRNLLVAILFSDIVANILIQNTAANLFGDFSSWFLKVGVPLIITLVLGEILPKNIALPFNTKIAVYVAPSMKVLQKVLDPILNFLTLITSKISRVLFFFLKKEKDISKDELLHMLKSSEDTGILNREETKLIQGYLFLTDYTIKERMQPRGEILFYDIEEPLTKLTYLFVEKECSRVPVCRGDIQNLIGIISAKLFFLQKNTIHEGKDLIPYLKKPYYVPETISARSLLRHFLRREETMGIVVDEYGSISGLITEEDLFEVVVGEIVDRRDEKARYTSAGKDVVITSGKFDLSEFETLFGVSLPTENNMVTLGGWLTEQLGDIPKSGTTYVWGGFLFQVLAADPNRVRRIYIRRLKNE